MLRTTNGKNLSINLIIPHFFCNFAANKRIGDKTMATAIKAIPTLKGKEAREFLLHAEEAERNFKGSKNKDQHTLCVMAHEILSKAGLL